jgi:hypothetical protein
MNEDTKEEQKHIRSGVVNIINETIKCGLNQHDYDDYQNMLDRKFEHFINASYGLDLRRKLNRQSINLIKKERIRAKIILSKLLSFQDSGVRVQGIDIL